MLTISFDNKYIEILSKLFSYHGQFLFLNEVYGLDYTDLICLIKQRLTN